ncbi:DUF3466 family protein [uncultured Paraglaciecola sp.]|uniref:DUF3466 family protein n=1 Tax=uncultured Paraglaciecola sp. TaxID=1765024 RepID=UPI00262F2D69|nr:DUF3466 family protein [uncultured Paraglaciecola sp.]
MTKTRLAAALSIALLVAPISQAAKYRVVELPVGNVGENSFPSAINNNGTSIVNVSNPYNVPIDLTLLDFESDTLIDGLTDVESASNGDFNIADYEILLGLIRAADGSQSAQQIASNISFLVSEGASNYIAGFDQRFEGENTFSLSTNNITKDINDLGFAVGSAEGFYKKVNYTFQTGTSEGEENTFIVRDFATRGFVNLPDNSVVDLPAPETLAGGFSEAYSINANNQVVGYGTTLFTSESLQESVNECNDDEQRSDVPKESCISSVINSFSSSVSSFAQLRGLIWQLDSQGNLVDTKELGILFEPEEDDTRNYTSQALAINDNGIAVGVSNNLYVEKDVTVTRNYAVIFNQDEIINLTPETDRNVARSSNVISSAADINNDNLVVGYQVKSINGANRTKFFVYDMNLAEMTFPEDFFLGSSSVALDINNNGLVVGYGDIDASLTGRRTEGFLYDNNTGQFNGLSDLISCDSPYTLVQSNSINDNNEILATALYKGPSRDLTGEVILDDDGNQVLVDLVKAVKLVPISGGELESCEEPVDEINRDRQGATATWLIGLGLLLLTYRRKTFRIK